MVRREPVALALLHGFELRSGDLRVRLGHSTQRLVALLALHARPARRDWVAGMLWLDTSQARANGSLRTTLWRSDPVVRRIVRCTASELALDDDVDVDVRGLDACAHRVLDGAGGKPDLRDLQAAGDLLPDWYDDWVVLERERLRVLRVHALEALCADLARRGQYADAAEAGLAAVGAEPLRESAQRALITAYLAEGNPSDALHQYALFRDLLRRELGRAPSPLLQRLVADIVPVTLA